MPHVVLENVTTGKKFKVKNNPTISYVKDNSVTQLPLTELPEESTNLIKVMGVMSKWTISFDLITDIEDLSMGTNTPPIRTIWQQIDYLTSAFVTEKISETHRVTVTDGTTNYLIKQGAFTKVSIDFPAGQGEKARATIELLVGTVV
jgi:hypothetical protein